MGIPEVEEGGGAEEEELRRGAGEEQVLRGDHQRQGQQQHGGGEEGQRPETSVRLITEEYQGAGWQVQERTQIFNGYLAAACPLTSGILFINRDLHADWKCYHG